MFFLGRTNKKIEKCKVKWLDVHPMRNFRLEGRTDEFDIYFSDD